LEDRLTFFVFFITPLPPWDPPDAWRRPHPKRILYGGTALFCLWGSDPPHSNPTEPGLPGGTAVSCRGLGTAEGPHRNFAIVGAGRCTLPELPRTAHLGEALGSLRTRILSPPGHSLGFPATSAWSQGPPCAQGNVSGFSRRLRLRLSVQLFTLRRVSVSVFGGLLRQSTHRRLLPGKF
jgi:hypothetical protein